MWKRIKNLFSRKRETYVIVESPSSFYKKTGTVHPRAEIVEFRVGNVVCCRITNRKAIVTHVTYLPPDRNYMYRFDGIGFDGHGWWSHHAYLIADNMDEYLKTLDNKEKL